MTAPANPPGLDPAAIVALAEELPGVARKLAQLIDDDVEQRARLARTLLADWRGGARGDFDASEAAHAARAAAVVAHLRGLAADVVDAAAAARRDLPPPPPGRAFDHSWSPGDNECANGRRRGQPRP